jgi:azurin
MDAVSFASVFRNTIHNKHMRIQISRSISAIALVATMALGACNNKGTEGTGNGDSTATKTDSSMATDSSKMAENEGPAYDKTKIDASAKVVEVAIEGQGANMAEVKFSTNEIKVAAGTTVKLTLTNKSKGDGMNHNWVLCKAGTFNDVATKGITHKDNGYVDPADANVLVATKLTLPGEKADITFPAPAKGTYDFVCTMPGHAMKMNGKLIVE